MIRSWNDAFFITIGFPKQKLLKSQPSINDKKKIIRNNYFHFLSDNCRFKEPENRKNTLMLQTWIYFCTTDNLILDRVGLSSI